MDKAKATRRLAVAFLYYVNPSAATVALIVNSRGALLVTRRAHEPAKGTLDLPGGFIDSFETGEEGVAREVLEETGLIVKEAIYQFSLPNLYVYSGFAVHTLDLFYVCRVDDAEVVQAQDDAQEAFFIPTSQINPNDFGLASVRKGLTRFLKEL